MMSEKESNGTFHLEGFKHIECAFDQDTSEGDWKELHISLDGFENEKSLNKILAKTSLYTLHFSLSGQLRSKSLPGEFLVLEENGSPITCKSLMELDENKTLSFAFRDIFPNRSYSLHWMDQKGKNKGYLFQNFSGHQLQWAMAPDPVKGDFLLYSDVELSIEVDGEEKDKPLSLVITWSNGSQTRVETHKAVTLHYPTAPAGEATVSILNDDFEVSDGS